MAKPKKKAKQKQPNKTDVKLPEKGRGAYEDKISVNGSFMDILKASGKDAANHSAKKKP